ncbi:DUF6268 family outer membrane beta-barrel protein [Yeosuana sp. AK3]
MKKFLNILFVFLNIIASFSQTDSSSTYCIPALKGVPIGKGVSIEYQNVSGYSLETIDKTGDFSNSKNDIKSNTNLEIKLKVPVINKDYLSIVVGLKYNKEEFHFKNQNQHPFYQNLEDRGLQSIGANVTIIKPTKSKKFWVLKANADLNGDFGTINSFSDYLKFSISPALGWKVNDNFSYALGASYNYRFGSPIIIPVVAFNININEKWGLEAILPLFVKSRYQYNNGLIWRNAIEIDGASYKIANFNSQFNNYSNLHLHRSDIQLTTRIEKKLIGWLWAASEVGLRKNLTYNLTNSNRSRDRIVFENNLSNGFLFNVSLFISPR